MQMTIRWRKAVELLIKKKCDLFLIDDPTMIFYLTGVELSLGRLYLGREKKVLFVDGRYFEYAKKTASCDVLLSKEENFRSFFLSLEKKEIQVGFDSNNVTVLSHQHLLAFAESMKKLNRSLLFKDLYFPFCELRLLKESKEIAALQSSASLNWKGFEHVCSLLKEGVTEEEMAWEFEKFCREGGAEKMAFDPIIAFGENSACPHHHPGKRALKKNEIVLIDVGVMLDSYASDMTRSIFFGSPHPKLAEFYTVVQRAQRKALMLCKPGERLGALDEAARKEITAAGFGELFVHRLGHGVGLEVHEYPSIAKEGEDSQRILEPGMVFTVEPGIYLQGLGGVRYEDTIVITDAGYENFYSVN
jgi:Xaa-Pro aminopeptidase